RDDSEVSRLHASGRGPTGLGSELSACLHEALDLAEETGRAFDPTIGRLIEVWDLRGSGRLPSNSELDRARRRSGAFLVHHDAATRVARLRRGVRLDFGGIGKGQALDRAAERLRAAEVESALLDFGGQLVAIGAPPGEDAWTVALASPVDRAEPAVTLHLRDASLATSSQSERRLAVDDVVLGHVLDPRRGHPLPVVGSASILCDSAARADALSTACLVLGRQRCLELAERWNVGVCWLEPSSTSDFVQHNDSRFREQLFAFPGNNS
ncbi:MAG: FAD:protein FMN transferase, partial [Acidobacteriota bacterium]